MRIFNTRLLFVLIIFLSLYRICGNVVSLKYLTQLKTEVRGLVSR